MANPEYYTAVMRGARTAKEIEDCLVKAQKAQIGDAAIKNLKRLAQEKVKYLRITKILNENWHRQHKVNGASQCQPAILASQEYDELVMQLDPNGSYTGNKHNDPNAIALYTFEDALRVGYISAKADEFGGREGGLAKWLSGRIKNGEQWACYVIAKVGQGKASLGLRIELVQLKGQPVTDWPGEVKLESEPPEPVPVIDMADMDKKLTKIYVYREMLGTEARKEFKKIRAFRVKYGKYNEDCLNWLDTQIENLDFILSL